MKQSPAAQKYESGGPGEYKSPAAQKYGS
jgi:hypothetical protein